MRLPPGRSEVERAACSWTVDPSRRSWPPPCEPRPVCGSTAGRTKPRALPRALCGGNRKRPAGAECVLRRCGLLRSAPQIVASEWLALFDPRVLRSGDLLACGRVHVEDREEHHERLVLPYGDVKRLILHRGAQDDRVLREPC